MTGRASSVGFDEAVHPRGQPDNPGKFKRRALPTPPKASSRQATRASREPKPTLFAKVMRDSGQWSFALSGRSVGLIEAGTKAEAVSWAEDYMRSNGGGEIRVTDSRGDVQRRYIVRAAHRAQLAKVTVRHAKRGAKVVYGPKVEEALLYGRATSHRSRAEALERARAHLADYGGGEIEIQNPAGTVIGQETVPPPEWWLGEEAAANGSGDGE